MLTFILLAAVAMHGIGHVLFFGPAIGLADWGSGHSWLLTGILGAGVARTIAGAIWVSAGALFIVGVAGFVRDAEWWRAATIAAAVVSLIGTVVYCDGIKQPSGIAALVFNILVLGALVVARWPSTATLA
jgi:membrane-associated PAP2 superfamily phosphatase